MPGWQAGQLRREPQQKQQPQQLTGPACEGRDGESRAGFVAAERVEWSWSDG